MHATFWRSLLAFAFISSGISHAAESAPPKTFRLVHLTVIGVDGKPAAHRKVYLRGWSAHWGFRCWGPFNDENEGKADGWPYATDNNGKVTVSIGDFLDKSGQWAGPGWGTYAFLIDAGPDDAGGVSTRFWIGAPIDQKEDWAPEWGRPIPLPPGGLDLTLSIPSGITVTGRIVDDQNLKKPLAGIHVDVGTDLALGTQSGIGNDIFDREATTDQDGRFIIRHCFPNLLWVSVDPALWMQTKVNGVWTQADNRITPASPTASIDLEMAGRPKPAFHYTGRVIDAKGLPVPDANVEASFTTEPIHSHLRYGMQEAKTDVTGHYSLFTASPWVNFVSANAPNNGACYVQTKSTASFAPPGNYDLKLPATAPIHPTTPPPLK